MFRAAEVFDIALAIEANGVKFYQALAGAAGDQGAKKLFKNLAAAEQRHIDDFTRLKERVAAVDAPESFPGEYQAYLQALVDGNVFAGDFDPQQVARGVKSDRDALELGIGFEKEGILFFGGLANLVAGTEAGAMAELLRQERAHLCQLQAALADLEPQNAR